MYANESHKVEMSQKVTMNKYTLSQSNITRSQVPTSKVENESEVILTVKGKPKFESLIKKR